MAICSDCRRAGLDHDEIVAKIRSNPYWTGRLICGFDKLSPSFHQNIAEWFAKKIADGKRRFIIMTPRDHYKTTLFGISTMIWFILNNPEVRILYMMSSCVEAAKKMGSIKDVLTGSEHLQHFLPNFVPDLSHHRTKWTDEVIKLHYRRGVYPEGTIEARGLTSRVTGGHFNVHIFDDLIDETMINSALEQERAIGVLRRSDALFVDIARDIEVIIGTRWPGPFYDYVLEESGMIEDYETLVIGAYVDDRYRKFMAEIGKKVTLNDGDPIFPEQFSVDALEIVRKKAGTFDFSHQWLNIKADEEQRRFREEDFQFYALSGDGEGGIADGKPFRFENLYRTMTIDLATGEDASNDKSAITVCGYERATGRIFLLDAWHGHALPHEMINTTLEYAQKWKPHVVSPEDVAYQKTFKHYLRQEMQVRGINFRVQPVKPGSKGKGARIIDSLQPFVRNHQLYVQFSHKPVIKELVNLQVVGGKVVGRSPNLADSLAYHAEHWRINLDHSANDDVEEKIPEKMDDCNALYGLECTT